MAGTKRSIAYLEGRFETGDIPTQQDFYDWLASFVHLDDQYFLGAYVSLAALQSAHPTATVGDYAYVDAGAASDILLYVWDSSDAAWVLSGSGTTPDATNTLKGKLKLFTEVTDEQRTDGSPSEEAITDHINKSNFNYSFESKVSPIAHAEDYRQRAFLKNVIYRLKQSHIVGSGGGDYVKALESVAAFSQGELWIKFTGDDFTATLERKIVVTTGTLSTITPAVSRVHDFQRFKKLIPKYLLKSGTGAATTDVDAAIYNAKTMAELRVYVERWVLDDASTFGDKPYYPPRVSTKFFNGIGSHPFYDRFYLRGVSGTLNDADYLFEKVQASYATIKALTVQASQVNDRGYVVIPFTCELANCLKVTLNGSAGSSTITDQFINIKL